MSAHYRYPASYLFLLQRDRGEVEAEFRRRREDGEAATDHVAFRPSKLPGRRHSNLAIRTRRFQASDSQAPPFQFDLWRIEGHRTLEHEGAYLRLAVERGGAPIGIGLPGDVGQGDALTFEIPCGEYFHREARLAVEANRVLCGNPPAHGSSSRPPSQQLLLMRALIALDARLAGASYRQTAEAVFGRRVVQARWTRDTTLKEQTRYLVRKARHLMGLR